MTLPLPRDIVSAVLNCSPESLTPASGLARHPNWDSFAHLSVMLALEQHYGVDISDATIRKYDTFAAIEDLHASLEAGVSGQ